MKALPTVLTGSLICLVLAASPGHAASGKAGIGPSFKGPLGLQLYSLRDQFKQDVPGTLQKVEDLGFRYAELAGTYGMTAAQFTTALKAHKIKPIGAHFPYERFRDEPESVAAEAKSLGLKYAGVAWIPHDKWDEKTCRDAAAVFNKAGAVMKKHDLKFFYHNHGYEFVKTPNGTLFDLLMAETDPKLVSFEMDVFWVTHPGHDPAKLLEKYGKRWELMHIKDMRKGTETGLLTGGTDVRNDVALGQGQIDMKSVLRAAKKAGVKWYFIEDESPDVEKQLPVSLHYLETVRF